MRAAALALLLAGCPRQPTTVPSHHTTSASACLPKEGAYTMARVGRDIVLCVDNLGWSAAYHLEQPLRQSCFTLDANGVTARAFAPLPGISFAFEGRCLRAACWSEVETRVRIARHPDGKHAAVAVGDGVSVFDLATGERIARFDVSSAFGDFWFVGQTVYVMGLPAGPYYPLFAFTLDGTTEDGPPADDLYHGNITLTDPEHLMYESGALLAIELLDGKGPRRRTHTRKVPPMSDCGVTTEGFSDPDGDGPCTEYVNRHFAPYVRALVVADADQLVGFTPARHELFILDGKTLEERSRKRLPVCER